MLGTNFGIFVKKLETIQYFGLQYIATSIYKVGDLAYPRRSPCVRVFNIYIGHSKEFMFGAHLILRKISRERRYNSDTSLYAT